MIPESPSLYDVANEFLGLLDERVGRPQKPAQFVNKPQAPFPGATSFRVKTKSVFIVPIPNYIGVPYLFSLAAFSS